MSQYDPKTFKPSTSAPIKTMARLLCEVEWTTSRDAWMRFAVYETRGGAYIAVSEGEAPGKPDQVERDVTVVEAIPKLLKDLTHQRDEIAMQIAVLDHFSWHDRAKSMLKRELGWSPVREVA